MSTEAAVRSSITPGQVLHTPSRGKPFVVDRVDDEGVLPLLGEKANTVRLRWSCLGGRGAVHP